MKKNSKILSMLMSLIMVLGALSACGKEPAIPPTVTPDATTAPGTETTAPLGEEIPEPDLPEVRYDGQDFNIRVKGDAVHWETLGIYAEQKTGEPINDATLERNNKIEEQYGVVISTIEGSGVAGDVVTSALSQTHDYDLAIDTLHQMSSVAPKSVYDLKQLQYIDLEKPWYDQNFNNEASIGGRLFATTGDLVINDDNATWCVLFNKRIASDYGIENPYKLVSEGKWTLDKLYELAKPVTHEDTGNDSYNYEDFWGLVTEQYNGYAMVASAGEKIASKDSSDMPYLTANTEKFQTVFEKAVTLLGDTSVACMIEDWSNDSNYANPFKVGRGLFVMAGLYDLDEVREIDDEIGVLTMPKYEESQEVALSPVEIYCFTCAFIPISVADIEKSSVITEAMFAASRSTTRVAFYETTLKKKYSPDEETKLILDKVIENRTYDLGAVYGWGGVVSRAKTLMSNRSSNFASAWKGLERVATSAMNKTVKDFQKAENVEG